ncbi:16S rRNA (uracil(1498)-N(3))-methyltransferase [cyanobiont of Ornithocercus magnificus]|nr:16S rRNA (uracil(1498)-N(3))-methyltransferase [cyanobiont of Ornithocercus magnificus]
MTRLEASRRLLIAPVRWPFMGDTSLLLPLNSAEQHYLWRVLRLQKGETVAVVDGAGRLCYAYLKDREYLELSRATVMFARRPFPRLGLAVAVPRRGMDNLLRMICELGMDQFIPLQSVRRTPQAQERPVRWASILRESVEQCERLWLPDLHQGCDAASLWNKTPIVDRAATFIATARCQGLDLFEADLAELPPTLDQVWVAIGPEGGWDPDEQRAAEICGWRPTCLGKAILRTDTAAVAAAHSLAVWRHNQDH